MTLIAALSLLAWCVLAAFRGGFWRADQRLNGAPGAELAPWPSVAAIIPARNEAASVAAVVAAHMGADYRGAFNVILVDDQSSDATADIARAAAADRPDRLTIIEGAPLPDGWSGKLWAVAQGVRAASADKAPAYFLLTDADIVFAPDTLSRLVAKAEAGSYSLVSLMARLDARGFWGGLLIPAFVFFFQKLYPFALANDPNDNVAAAAGGCMLVRASDLAAAGGIAAFRDQLIDDCALARTIKDLTPATRIWIGLADDEAVSQRDNRSLSSVWMMVARTAFTQLRLSPLMLVLSVMGMALLYLAPPIIAVSVGAHGNWFAAALALIAWGVMARLYYPTLKLYGGEPWQTALLPAAAALYAAMSVDSARQHWRGRGGQWKGRYYDLRKTS